MTVFQAAGGGEERAEQQDDRGRAAVGCPHQGVDGGKPALLRPCQGTQNRLNSARVQYVRAVGGLSRNSDCECGGQVMQALEEDKRAMEQQLQVVAGDAEKLREKEVMWAMKMMMEEEMAKKATLKRHEERQGVIRSALTR